MVNCLPLSPHPLHPHKKDHLAVGAVQTVGCCLNLAGGRKFTAQARQLDIPRGTQAEPRQPKDRHKSNLFLCRRQHLRLLLVCPTFGLGVSGRQSLALYNWLGQSILLRLAMKVTCQDRNSSGREWIWWDFCKRTLSMCDLSTFAWF